MRRLFLLGAATLVTIPSRTFEDAASEEARDSSPPTVAPVPSSTFDVDYCAEGSCVGDMVRSVRRGTRTDKEQIAIVGRCSPSFCGAANVGDRPLAVPLLLATFANARAQHRELFLDESTESRRDAVGRPRALPRGRGEPAVARERRRPATASSSWGRTLSPEYRKQDATWSCTRRRPA